MMAGFINTDRFGRNDSPDATDVLLIHGAGGSSRHWRWVAAELAADLAPVGVDLPGHGASPGRTPRTVEAATDAVIHAVECEELCREPGIVVGHSAGGLVALDLAYRYPHLVAGLLLIGTAARIGLHPDLLTQLGHGRVERDFLRGAFHRYPGYQRFEQVVTDFRRLRVAQRGDLLGLADHDSTEKLAALSMNVLVLVGEHDVVVAPRRSRAMAARFRHGRLRSVDAGHYLPLECPDVVAEAIDELALSRRVVTRRSN